jgi:hypothetical protein
MNIQIPVICGIPLRHLWIPPSAAFAAYITSVALRKIFPRLDYPEHVRNREDQETWHAIQDFASENAARVERRLIFFRMPQRQYARFCDFIHVDIKDNLPLVVFFFATVFLKEPSLREELPLLFSAVCLTCCFLTPLRKKTSDFFSSSLGYLPNNQRQSTFAKLIDQAAKLIAPSPSGNLPSRNG